MTRVVTYPDPADPNPYFGRYYGALAAHGFELVGTASFGDDFLRDRGHTFDILHVHWAHENVWRVRGPGRLARLRGVIGLWRFLRLARRMGKTVVWTAHDLESHEGRQFVDRLGTAMVKSSFRPAYRLLLFGLLYYVVLGLFEISHVEFLDAVARALDRVLGPVLQVLGSICFAVLGVGWWLRRIAGQATDFFAQAARAQFLGLTESIKGRHVERHAAILDRRVLAPERARWYKASIVWVLPPPNAVFNCATGSPPSPARRRTAMPSSSRA